MSFLAVPWFDNAEDLRDTFRTAFKEQTGLSESQTRLIKLAGKAGILIRYGTAYDSGLTGMIGVRDPNMEDFRYLDALLSESHATRVRRTRALTLSTTWSTVSVVRYHLSS